MCETEEFEKRIKDACLDELFETVQIISTCSVLDDEFLAKKADAVLMFRATTTAKSWLILTVKPVALILLREKIIFTCQKKASCCFSISKI